jgi:LysR family transcriptional regulator, cyn operon transcriptional activator
MELRQLDMLLAIAESGGYKQAGKSLHVSHSAIHRQIRLLEYELHERLLVRAGKYVQFTETGELLLQAARRIQQEISNVKAQVSSYNQLLSGSLHIGTGTAILTFFLPSVLHQFKKLYPGIEVQITTSHGDEVVHAIQQGRLDVGVVYSPTELLAGETMPRHELLYSEEFVLAASKDHPLSRRKLIALKELKDHGLILFPGPSHLRRAFDRLCDVTGVRLRIIMELENEESMEKMMMIYPGVALLSKRRALKDKFHCFRLREGRIISEVGIIFPNLDYLPRATLEFANLCRKAAHSRVAVTARHVR